MGAMGLCFLPIIGFLFMEMLQIIHGQGFVPSPAPTSTGSTIDQGIAFVLMIIALAVTYLVH